MDCDWVLYPQVRLYKVFAGLIERWCPVARTFGPGEVLYDPTSQVLHTHAPFLKARRLLTRFCRHTARHLQSNANSMNMNKRRQVIAPTTVRRVRLVAANRSACA